MNVHPIIYYPSRWIAVIAITLVASALYALLVSFTYSLPFGCALADCLTSAILIDVIAYPLWYLLGFMQGYILQSVVILIQTTLWILGSLVINEFIQSTINSDYVSFIDTLPIRIPLGISLFVIILLWYKSILCKENNENIIYNDAADNGDTSISPQEIKLDDVEIIDTITIKNKNKITIIKIEDIIYITACGDYVSILTKDGEFIKEQTMKYFETHLPSSSFLRIHRSTIVNVTHISGLELYGKESYSLLMKDGKSLKVSLSGYRLLKEKLNL